MENNRSVFDCSVIDLGKISFDEGNLTVVENNSSFPFNVKRVFYLYDIAGGESRGAHSHKECHQFLIAASGSFEVSLDDGKFKRQVFLNRPDIGLHIPPGIWASEINFSSGAICLVLASHPYNESDYIRNYEDFLNLNNLQLVNYTKDILEKSWNWLNDPEIKHLTSTPNFSKEDQQNWFLGLEKNDSYWVQGIQYDNKIIGVAGLKKIDPSKKTAEYFGYIGEKEYWGKGLSKDLFKLIFKIAKDQFALESLYLNVVPDNIRAVKSYEKAGFSISDRTDSNITMSLNL
ncbi:MULTISPECIES: GNAT family N-acetyltransferase [Chryseobacterium]|uniref:RimJ/RimL family protein N-acetyltransferase/mannose-6-phosphate isomerase-like protein (Cupin superfamily) n=1 Tax=Chryseobacterium geocarposphaerae TaxID=1416776 RepID=A0ABU1LFJ8_9FLAO|nr:MULTISPECIES: GNAT family N-acetyltransferase [Chryseobacterium]MDR6405345.1 RimJ/RimL family protein N-acetyltransferase/mannose-6-phosphate isomerase-like protein (cupin superfamily) [Chryseobacterium geocarposphaerae]MDR6697504.1 RimJ/RimL family protein N-acetyltransferase/mannose-6-phosphate isomerase-like protein (cupin superfamily) [Chryseobacterium ginsenosidimutans]